MQNFKTYVFNLQEEPLSLTPSSTKTLMKMSNSKSHKSSSYLYVITTLLVLGLPQKQHQALK